MNQWKPTIPVTPWQNKNYNGDRQDFVKAWLVFTDTQIYPIDMRSNKEKTDLNRMLGGYMHLSNKKMISIERTEDIANRRYEKEFLEAFFLFSFFAFIQSFIYLFLSHFFIYFVTGKFLVELVDWFTFGFLSTSHLLSVSIKYNDG